MLGLTQLTSASLQALQTSPAVFMAQTITNEEYRRQHQEFFFASDAQAMLRKFLTKKWILSRPKCHDYTSN